MPKEWWKYLLAWRVWLVLVAAVAAHLIAYRPAYDFTGLRFYQPELTTWLPAFIWSWANFDGVIFLRIATTSLLEEPRFLPLYPFLIKVVSGQWWGHSITFAQVLAGLLIAHTTFLVAIKYLCKVLKNQYPGPVVTWMVWLLVAFPLSFFFVSLYTESLFLSIVVLAFWGAQKEKWWLSFGLVGLASLTRLPGILLLLPIVWEYVTACRLKRLPLVGVKTFFYLGLAVMPLLMLMTAHWGISGDALKFVHAHGELANSRSTSSLVFPVITGVRYLKILTSLPLSYIEWWIALLELASAFLIGLSLYWSWKLKIRVSYQIYAVCMVILPLLSGTFSGLPRYLTVVFPLFLAVALKTHAWSIRRKWLLISLLLLIQMVLVGCFVRGYFVA